MNFETSLRTYDANLYETDDPARVERLENLAQDEIFYILDSYNVDESTLMERYAAFSAVEWSQGEPYLSVLDGGLRLHNDVSNDSTNAFTFDLERQGHQVSPAIYYDDSLSQFKLSHEMFHIMSTSISDFIDRNTGNIYLKRGIKLISFSSNGQPIHDPLSASPRDSGLNEGITELLAKRFWRTEDPVERTSFEYHKNHPVAPEYKQYSDLVDILSAPEHNQIIEAYFADDPYAPRNFMNDFDSRQNQASSWQLESLDFSPSSGFFDAESLPQGFIDERVVMACVEYATSFYQDADSLDREWQRIIPIAEHIIRQNIALAHPAGSAANRYFDYISDTLNYIYEALTGK